MWDDYDWVYYNPDEDNWERYRDKKINIVHGLLDFLCKLNVAKKVEVHYEAAGFVDRFWKV